MFYLLPVTQAVIFINVFVFGAEAMLGDSISSTLATVAPRPTVSAVAGHVLYVFPLAMRTCLVATWSESGGRAAF